MDKQSCITEQHWLGYSNKSLNPAETDLILNHIATCEVCADIKDGIDAMSKPEKLGDTIASINKRADEYLQPKRNLTVLWYWSAAAVLVMGIGLSWFWIKEQAPVAKKTNDSLKIADQPVIKEDLNNEVTQNDIKPEPQITIAQNGIANAKPTIVYEKDDSGGDDGEVLIVETLSKTMDAITMPDTAQYVVTPGNDTIPRGTVLAFGDTKLDDEAFSAPPTYGAMEKDDETKKELNETVEIAAIEKKKATANSKVTSIPAPMNNSNTLNNNSNTNYAWVNYAYKQDSAIMVLAQSHFNQNYFGKCIDNLKPVTQNPSSLFYEDGLLLKAKALIKQNKNKEAKAVLKKVFSLNSVRKLEADGILKGLK